VELASGIEILRDPSGALSREEALGAAFSPAPPDLQLGLVRGAVWVRFAVENRSGEPARWALALQDPALGRIDLWVDRRGEILHRRGGLLLPPAERQVALRGPWHEIPLALPAREGATVLARLESVAPLSVSAVALRADAAAPALAGRVVRDGLLLGILLALAGLAAAAGWAARDRVALVFGGLAAALAGLVAASGGVGAALLWPGAGRWAVAAPPVFSALAALAGLRLCADLLGRPLRGGSAAVAWFAAAAAALPFAAPRAGQVAAGVAVLAALALAAVWSGAAARERRPGAAPVALALVPLLVVGAADVLAAGDLLPARPAGSPSSAAAFAFACAVLAGVAAARLRTSAAARSPSLARAVEARTEELADAIEALRREEEARRRAEAGRREAEEELLRLRQRAALGVAEGTPRPRAAPRVPLILVVDEDDLVREGTRRMLERLGFRVLEAADGRDALRLGDSAGGVDLVVADVVLRGMGGKELADRAVARWPGVRVLLTAGSAQDVLGPSPGGFPYLPKPFSPSALAAKVSQLLGPAGARRTG
jgi:CheY-like chemotaxis protein